ncbi:hypothetical protein D9600_14875 [Deinococcus sp. DB0503]|nr:hypothetical protein [Deinococcus sp. DB0503]
MIWLLLALPSLLAVLWLLACCRMAGPRTPEEQAAEDEAQARALSRPVDMDDVVRALGGEGL